MPAESNGAWTRAASVNEVGPGTLHGVQLGAEKIVLANVDGDLYALQDRCSHADFPLHDGFLEGTEVECIRHGAKFDVCSGRALSLPAIRPVKAYEVEVRDGEIFVQLG